MKDFIVLFIVSCAAFAVVTSTVIFSKPHLLGNQECTFGPSFWCNNLTNAAGCEATKYCIKTWKTMKVKEDNDSVCDVCKNMVKQARDQLESNETQEELDQVFRGSCNLIMIKPIVKECYKLVDSFVPELVETVAAQMDPSVVCTVAGLCNSLHFDKLLRKYETKDEDKEVTTPMTLENDQYEPNDCSKCYTITNFMAHKFHNVSKDKFATGLLMSCANLGLFSDACSSIVLTHINEIYEMMDSQFTPDNICHLTGKCSDKFHVHDEQNDQSINVEIRPLSSVGMVDVDDDLPCKLCEQLVQHLRDVLVANTTETEFKMILDGFCSQTKSFASQCKSIVDEYYPEIYSALVNGLDKNAACQMAGICPAPDLVENNFPIWPLRVGLRIVNETEIDEGHEEKVEKHSDLLEVNDMQLPMDKLLAPSLLALPQMDEKGRAKCEFCEYFFHFIQEVLTTPATEEDIKEVIDKACVMLPEQLKNTCFQFVEQYGEALVALLVQEIDPSQICPKIYVCPSKEALQLWNSLPKDLMLQHPDEQKKKPSCQLCLLAMENLYDYIKDDKTEAGIEKALDELCNHLSESVKDQCQDLVKGYSEELIKMLLANISPKEICTTLKLCNPKEKVAPRNLFRLDIDHEIMTNEIPNPPQSKPPKEIDDGPVCDVCQLIMKKVEKKMENPKTMEQIEKIMNETCNDLYPKSLRKKCSVFIDKYGKMIIDLLVSEVTPKEVCGAMALCETDPHTKVPNKVPTPPKDVETVEDGPLCKTCEVIMDRLEKQMVEPKTREYVKEVMKKVCNGLEPESLNSDCNKFVNLYGDIIVELLIRGVDPKAVCGPVGFCKMDLQVQASYMECEVCQMATNELKHLLENASVDDKIEDIVAQLCSYLPSQKVEKCKMMVKIYGQSFINIIKAQGKIDEICDKLSLCSESDNFILYMLKDKRGQV